MLSLDNIVALATRSAGAFLAEHRLSFEGNPVGNIGMSLKRALDWCAKNPDCKGNLGVPRSQMPQIKPEFTKDFFAWVEKEHGVKTKLKMWKAKDLRATQKEISEDRIKSMMDTGRSYLAKNPMIASKDGYILDGHHRWATLLTIDPNAPVKTYTVDLPIRVLLGVAARFPNVKGSLMKFDPSESRKARSVLAKADVTPVRQRTQFTCMTTSMMMCLQANGVECDEDEVNRVMGARAMEGATWEDAIACAQHYGMRVTLICPSTVKQLKDFTDRKIPVMIAWNPEGRDWSHASVVFDVDDDLKVFVADPNIPDPDETVRKVPKGEFYGKWFEKWPNYMVRRPAMAVEREITEDGHQVVASKGLEGLKEQMNMKGTLPESAQKAIIQDLASSMGSRMAKTADALDSAVSKLHTEMAKAINSSITNGKVQKNDYWSSGVSIPREIGQGMYLQLGAQTLDPGGMSVYLSVWTPMSPSDDAWKPIYKGIADALKKSKSAMGRFGKVVVHDVGKAVKVWLDVPADKVNDAIRGLPAVARKAGADVNAVLTKAGRTAQQENDMTSFAEQYPPIHPSVEAMLRQAKPALSKDDIEKALKGAGLKYKYSAGAWGFLITGLGPMLSDAVDIELDHKGGAPKDATAWRANLKGKTVPVASRSDLSKVVAQIKKTKDAWEKKMQSKKATDALWAGLGETHPDVVRLIAAKDDDDDDNDDKEGKFEKGKSVPLSDLPDELQENVEDPPDSVKKLKDKLKKKGGDLPDRFTLMLEANEEAPPAGSYIDMDDFGLQVVQASLENVDGAGERVMVRLQKTAARSPGGLYGFTKQVQADCEIAARKLQKAAMSIASEAVKRDGKVANFWTERSKKAKSGTARMLLAAVEANRKFAAERGQEIEVGDGSKEAAITGFGYYGFRAKTANRAFVACLALKEAAGEIAAELHRRRAGEHGRITAFLQQHSKKAKCSASQMVMHAYPEASVKLAAGPSDTNSVAQWLEFDAG